MKTRLFMQVMGAGVLALSASWRAPAADLDLVENNPFTQMVYVVFDGASATISNGAGAGVSYVQNGAMITFTSTVENIDYVLSGVATGGYVKILGTPAVKITLNGLSLTATNGPALHLASTNRNFVVLAEDTVNTLVDGAAYTEAGEGTLYSVGPIVLGGRGSVSLTGRKKHGIYTASYLRMRGGDVEVLGAVKDGVHTLQAFRMDQGTLNITATGDAIDGDAGTVEINGGAITIQSAADDVKGIKCDGYFRVNGGSINVTMKGVQSKGLKSTADLFINGGTLTFTMSGAMYLTPVSVVTNVSGTIRTNSYVDPSYCTAIKCDSNLIMQAGTLTVTHSGLAGKGISADGDIVIRGGVLDLNTSGGCSTTYTNTSGVLDIASADCLKADRNLEILGGRILALSSGSAGDCLSAEGHLIISNAPSITAATRGVKVLLSGSGQTADYANPKAIKAQGNLTVYGGTIKVTTKNDGGEGLESKGRLTIYGGNLDVTAYDDCLNAASNIAINGGAIFCYSLGNDGIDSNGQMQYNGGTILSSGSTAPEEGFDCDANTFAISGGIMVGTGGASSTPTSSSCTQRSILYSASGMASGTMVLIKSATTNLLVYRIPRSYTSGGGGGGGGGGSLLLFSHPAITAGTTYNIVTGLVVSGGAEFHGFYTGATVSGGTTAKTFTASSSSMVTTVN